MGEILFLLNHSGGIHFLTYTLWHSFLMETRSNFMILYIHPNIHFTELSLECVVFII